MKKLNLVQFYLIVPSLSNITMKLGVLLRQKHNYRFWRFTLMKIATK